MPEDGVGEKAVRLLGAQERAQLVARRGGVEVAKRDRVPARVPQELGRELRRVGAVEAVLDPVGRAPDHLVSRERDARGALDGTSGHDGAE